MSIFQPENSPSKIYVGTAFTDIGSFLTVAKFSYKWLFSQPSKDDFAITALTNKKAGKIVLDGMIKKENLAHEEVGYIENSHMYIF